MQADEATASEKQDEPSARPLDISALVSTLPVPKEEGDESSSKTGPLSENLRLLIAQKERELRDINEYRVQTIESVATEKDKELATMREKYRKLREDFEYNYQLLQDRDEELRRYDTAFENLKNALREKDVELGERKVELASVKSKIKEEKDRSGEVEAMFQAKLSDMHASMESLRFQREEDALKANEQTEAHKRELQRTIEGAEEQRALLEAELKAQFDNAFRQREREYQSSEEEYVAQQRKLEAAVRSVSRQHEEASKRANESASEVQSTLALVTERDVEVRRLRMELEDTTKVKDARIAELETSDRQNAGEKALLLDEYETKVSQSLQLKHAAERALAQAVEDHTEAMRALSVEKDEAAERRMKTLNDRLDMVTQQLAEAERVQDGMRDSARQLAWDHEDKMKKEHRDWDVQRSELEHALSEAETRARAAEGHSATSEALCKGLSEEMGVLRQSLEERRVEIERHRSEAMASADREKALKAEIMQQHLKWEKALEETRSDIEAKNERLLHAVREQRDEAAAVKQELQERIETLAATASEKEHDMQGRIDTLTDMLSDKESELRNTRAELGLSEQFRRDERVRHDATPDTTRLMSSRKQAGLNVTVRNLGRSVGMSSELPSPISLPPPPSETMSPVGTVEVHRLRAHNQEMQTQNDRLKGVVREMREEMEALHKAGIEQTNVEEQCRVLERRVDELQQHNQVLIKRLDGQASGSQEEIDMMRHRAAAAVEEANQLRNDLNTAKHDALQWQDAANEAQGTLHALQAEVEELKGGGGSSASPADIEVLHAANAELAIENEALEHRLTEAQTRVSDLDAENTRLKNKVTDAAKDVQRLVRERDRLMEISNLLKGDLSRVLAESYQARTMAEAEQQVASKYEDKIKELEERHTIEEPPSPTSPRPTQSPVRHTPRRDRLRREAEAIEMAGKQKPPSTRTRYLPASKRATPSQEASLQHIQDKRTHLATQRRALVRNYNVKTDDA